MKIAYFKNKIDFSEVLIVLQLALLAFGNIGGAFAPVRLGAIFIAVATFRGLSRKFFLINLRSTNTFFIVFYTFLVTSLLWTNNISEGIKEVVYYFFHIIIFFNIVLLSKKAGRPQYAICIGWVAAVFFTLPVAFQEIVFDQHLSISVHEAGQLKNFGEGVIAQRIYASTTFGNFNGYVTFLGLSLPFLIAYILLANRFKNSIFGLFSLLSAFLIILINASRGGLISVFISLSIGLYFYMQSNKKYKLLKLLITSLITISIFIYAYDFLTFQIKSRLAAASIFEDNSRSLLLSSTWDLLSASNFIGSGVGSLEDSYKSLRIHEINVPHNFLIEFLVQYGVVFFIGLLIYLIKILILGLRSKNIINRCVIFIGFAILPFIGLVNSTYWLSPMLWCYGASLVVFSNMYFFVNNNYTKDLIY